jgi:hypothetical protein
MNNADGATPKRLLRMPKFAEMRAKGTMSLNMRSAPCENGSKTGTSRATLSRLKEEREATFPVQKNAAWRSVRKNRDTRASAKVRLRNGELEKEAGIVVVPFEALDDVAGFLV